MQKFQFKNSAHPDFDLTQKRVTVGRDKSNNIVLDQAGISGFHAEIHNEDGKLHIVDVGSANGSFVNGKKVIGRMELKLWDRIRLDSTEFELVDTEKRRPTEVHVAVSEKDIAKATVIRPAVSSATKTTVMPAIRPKLVGESGVVAGRNFELKLPASVGRGAENNLVIDHETISTCHARISDDGSGWRIDDLGSTNGTYINNAKITSSPVKHGDKVRLGLVELRFDCGVAVPSRTVVMPSVGSDTRTSIQPVVQARRMPVWAYGVGGFLVVGAIAAYFLFGDKMPIPLPMPMAKQVDAPLQTGKVWAQPLPNGANSPATPVVADINGDKILDVIVGDAHGHLSAFDGETGKQIFDLDVSDRILASLVSGDLSGDGQTGIVAATNAGGVIAVNGKGQLLWKSAPELALGQIVNRPVLHRASGEKALNVIVPTMDKGLVALDGSRGWKIWDTGDMMKGKVIASPMAADINGDGVMDFVAVTDSGQVLAVTTQGKGVLQLWQANVSAVTYASPTFVKIGKTGAVVVATGSGLVALAGDTGRILWQTTKPMNFFASPLSADVNGDGVADVIAVSVDGKVFAHDGKTGDEIWSLDLGVGVKASPALFDFTGDRVADVLVLDEAGALHVIDGARGRELLKSQVGGADAFVASPVLADVVGAGRLGIVMASANGQIAVHEFNRIVRKGDAPWPVFLGNNSHSYP